MWKLMLENTNHPSEHVEILKSSCMPLLQEVMWNVHLGFKKMKYKSFRVYIQSLDSGGIMEVDHANRPRV